MEGILKPYQIMPFARPREKHIIIPFGISVKGLYKLWLVDKITGKLKDYREGENLLTNEYRDDALKNGLEGNHHIIELGDDNTDPSRDDTGIIGNLISDDPDDDSTDTNSGDNPWEVEREYYFNADNANGTIWEMAIGGDPCHSRIVLDEAIDKTDTDELWITYKRQVYRGTNNWTGTITDGDKDGNTDIDWELTINDAQLKWLAEDGFHCSAVRLGDSNTSSDLTNDEADTLKGNEIAEGSKKGDDFLLFDTTVDLDNHYVEMEIGFDTGEANGDIGEAIIANNGNYGTGQGIFRCTFDPKLEKTDNWRLYLTFRGELDNW